MRIYMKGKIVLATTPGRQDHWVSMKVEHDYFLSLHITEISGQGIKTTQDAFDVLKEMFRNIMINKKNINALFGNITLPPGADDALHITLGNFGDFRFERDTAYDVDLTKVNQAEDIAGTEVTLELSDKDFELLGTSEHIENVKLSAGTVQKVDSVGFKRDATLNLKPSEATQKQLATFSKGVFGPNFELWNSRKKPITYHITIAQTNELSKTLEPLRADDKEEESAPVASSSLRL